MTTTSYKPIITITFNPLPVNFPTIGRQLIHFDIIELYTKLYAHQNEAISIKSSDM